MQVSTRDLVRRIRAVVEHVQRGGSVDVTHYGTPLARLVPVTVAAATDTKVEAYVEKITPSKTPRPVGRPSTKTDVDRYLASLPPSKMKGMPKGNYTQQEAFEYGTMTPERAVEVYGAERAKNYVRYQRNVLPGAAPSPAEGPRVYSLTSDEGVTHMVTEKELEIYNDTGMLPEVFDRPLGDRKQMPLNLPIYPGDE